MGVGHAVAEAVCLDGGIEHLLVGVLNRDDPLEHDPLVSVLCGKRDEVLKACLAAAGLVLEVGVHDVGAREFAAFRSASIDEFNAAVEGWLPGYTQWSNAA